MSPTVPIVEEDLADLSLLIRSYHPFIVIDEVEEARVTALLRAAARGLGMPFLVWTAHEGLRKEGTEGAAIYKTDDPGQCLAHLLSADSETVAYLAGFERHLDDADIASRFRKLHDALHGHRGAVVLGCTTSDLPPDLARLVTTLHLRTPDRDAYHRYVSQVLADVKKRMDVKVELTGADVAEMLEHLKGLPFYEVRKIVTQAIVKDGRLSREDILTIVDAKKQAVARTGVLEYIPTDEGSTRVAGLGRLTGWLDKRRAAFRDPEKARQAGLTPPRGLLLTGVQGCGKSLCARAIATNWRLPLVRLDPGSLFQKYFGESEKNLRRAINTAEAVAPVVLWIDEIEKAFGGSGGDQDGGTTRRVFGTFLTWLQEKKESVFVLATANDISSLPPELLRKGRFDEIFFVDLPREEVRTDIFRVHLEKRNKAPATFDLQALAEATEGFNGAEIEQVVVAGLYTSLSSGGDLSTQLLLDEIAETRPLSVTMSERIAELRSWARGRAVPAD